MPDQLAQANEAAFIFMNATDHSPAVLIILAYMAAKALVFFVPMDLVFRWLFPDAVDSRRIATVSLAALLAALSVSLVIGALFYTDRPFMSGLGHTVMAHRPSASFPSNHGIVCATHAMMLWMFQRRTAAMVFLVLGCATAWARIYLGVHFPLDMVGSVLVAGIVVAVVLSVSRRNV